MAVGCPEGTRSEATAGISGVNLDRGIRGDKRAQVAERYTQI